MRRRVPQVRRPTVMAGAPPGKRRAVDEDPQRQPATPEWQPEAGQLRLDARARRSPLASWLTRYSLPSWSTVSTFTNSVSRKSGVEPGEHPGADQPELLRAGDENADGRIRSRLAAASAATTPVPLSRAPSDRPLSRPRPRQETRQERPYRRPRPSHAGCKRAVEPERESCREHGDGQPRYPHRHQTPGHGMPLRLGVEVGHHPTLGSGIATEWRSGWRPP